MKSASQYIIKHIDEKAFEKLFKTLFADLCAFAAKFVNDLDTSKEIVHDVFVNLWQKKSTLDISKSLKPYLYSSVHNRCLNFIRDHKKYDSNVGIEFINQTSYTDAKDSIIEQELKDKIKETLAALPEKCRQVFELSRFEELKYNEIAEKLGISIKTVEAQMSKALKKLRENLAEYLTIILFILYMIYKTKFPN